MEQAKRAEDWFEKRCTTNGRSMLVGLRHMLQLMEEAFSDEMHPRYRSGSTSTALRSRPPFSVWSLARGVAVKDRPVNDGEEADGPHAGCDGEVTKRRKEDPSRASGRGPTFRVEALGLGLCRKVRAANFPMASAELRWSSE
ncbi:acyltransferase [Pseudozyma hubeiensis SY62]|uniref:Acyltransferase n=1 Tax=Pseudozyma hubeiensis (strain SY62) TaxID=1305764 RepID=R9PCB4_PSEHS|nr:acyltransferase [Pseudozyma hubeiensis SY62]GAC99053.1 acyltransferase [Pseudozyma hubeiensis SY62]